MKDTIKDIVAHPASKVAGVLSVLGFAIDPMVLHAAFTTVWGNVGTLFTASSIFSFTIAPNLPALPPVVEQGGIGLTLGMGGLYLAKLLDRVYDAYDDKTDENS
jgi:hypothetical protein